MTTPKNRRVLPERHVFPPTASAMDQQEAPITMPPRGSAGAKGAKLELFKKRPGDKNTGAYNGNVKRKLGFFDLDSWRDYNLEQEVECFVVYKLHPDVWQDWENYDLAEETTTFCTRDTAFRVVPAWVPGSHTDLAVSARTCPGLWC